MSDIQRTWLQLFSIQIVEVIYYLLHYILFVYLIFSLHVKFILVILKSIFNSSVPLPKFSSVVISSKKHIVLQVFSLCGNKTTVSTLVQNKTVRNVKEKSSKQTDEQRTF